MDQAKNNLAKPKPMEMPAAFKGTEFEFILISSFQSLK